MRPFLLLPFLCLFACSSIDVLGMRAEPPDEAEGTGGTLPNPLAERHAVPLSRVNAELNDAFAQLFFGDPETEAVFRDLGDGTGYVEDIFNQDVRTDAMGYGMLVSVQLNQREVFDKLWGFSKTYMLSQTGASAGLLRWRCDTSGQNCATSAATDASSVIATSLFIAESRWGSGGAHPYEEDALSLLDAMAGIEERNGGSSAGVVNCFDTERALPRPDSGTRVEEVPVDYLMPAFYEIWADRDGTRAEFWRKVAQNSRTLLKSAPHAETGLLPERITYEGLPVAGADTYQATTQRTHLNLALDALWNPPQEWVRTQNETRLDFFLDQGADDYVAAYTLDGEALLAFNTVAHRSLVAIAAGMSSSMKYDVFLEQILELEIPTGDFRYYDGMIYMLSLLVLSGQMTPD